MLVVDVSRYPREKSSKRRFPRPAPGTTITRRTTPNRMVKKRIHALFHRTASKMRFPACFIFNDLQSSKMLARPCAAHRLGEN